MMSCHWTSKLADALARLRGFERVLVAFSGGVDSVVVARLAAETLGAKNVLAVTGRSASVASRELESVARLAAECGVPHEFVDTAEFDDTQYLANSPRRCYHCKTELYGRLAELAAARGYDAVLSGANVDDLGDYRPGLEAGRKRNVGAPLAAAGMTKADVRAVAAHYGLSIADKPASPCLSSRVPYGEAITPEKLRQVDAGEAVLRELGFRDCRLRHHGELARVEVPADEIARFADAELRATVDGRLRELGFAYVALDLRGFRSGSLNEVLLGQGLAGVDTPNDP